MASKIISDDELRKRISTKYPGVPVVDSTRSILLEKLAKLQCNVELGIVSKAQSQENKQDRTLQKVKQEELNSQPETNGTPKQIKSSFLSMPHLMHSNGDNKPILQNQAAIKTFVFFDLEATGLPSSTTAPRITELCFKAVDVEHFTSLKQLLLMYEEFSHLEEIFPRVINSLNLHFNPCAMIPDVVTDLTGLSNELLEHQSRFKAETVQLLKLFLENLPQPICLVAHNGDRYDYPLLQAELFHTGLQNLIGDFYTIDSYTALKHIFDLLLQEEEMKNELFGDGDIATDNVLLNLDESIIQTPETEVKKPRLRDEDELNLYKTPEKSSNTHDFNLNPPPTGHSLNRRQTSELLSSDRRKNGEKVKKKLTFIEKPKSFSLPKLHEHIFGVKPKKSHGAEVDVEALIRVCASKADMFVKYSQKNYNLLKNVKKMW